MESCRECSEARDRRGLSRPRRRAQVLERVVDPWESVRIEVTDMREAGDTLAFVQLAAGLRE